VSIYSAGPGEAVPLVVKPKVAWQMLACSNTHGYELLAAGELESFLDGRSRKIQLHRFTDLSPDGLRRKKPRGLSAFPADAVGSARQISGCSDCCRSCRPLTIRPSSRGFLRRI
jgi:hypothetical protein